jgi:hypothetical protein
VSKPTTSSGSATEPAAHWSDRPDSNRRAQAAVHVTGRGRTCDASRFRRALYRLSYGHASSGTSRASPSISPLGGRSTQQAGAFPVGHGSRPLSRPTEAGTVLSMPLAYPSTLDHRPPIAHIRNGRRPTWRSFGAGSSHYGRKLAGKSTRLLSASIFQRAALRSFSLRRGLNWIWNVSR